MKRSRSEIIKAFRDRLGNSPEECSTLMMDRGLLLDLEAILTEASRNWIDDQIHEPGCRLRLNKESYLYVYSTTKYIGTFPTWGWVVIGGKIAHVPKDDEDNFCTSREKAKERAKTWAIEKGYLRPD